MKKIIIILTIVIFGGLVTAFFLPDKDTGQSQKFKEVVLDGKKISLELADTQEKREKGLSGRSSLCSGCGMLFIFDEKGTYPFWMKDMNFDLDMIWLSDDIVVQIDRNVGHAGGKNEIRFPKKPIDMILEVNAGESQRLGIEEGDQLDIR